MCVFKNILIHNMGFIVSCYMGIWAIPDLKICSEICYCKMSKFKDSSSLLKVFIFFIWNKNMCSYCHLDWHMSEKIYMTIFFKDLTSFLLQCRSSKLQIPLLLFYQEEIIFKIPHDYFLEFHVDCPLFHMMVLQMLRIGNTCIPVADSFWYLAKLIQFCKV